MDAGLFKRAGINVEITWTRGGAETLQAVITNSADLAWANGTLGVIGPTRMAYERVIPIVEITARLLSSALAK